MSKLVQSQSSFEDRRLAPYTQFVRTKSEWADYAAVQAYCGNLPGKELTFHSSGNTRSQSFQLAEPLWTDPSLKSGINLRELISTLQKKAQAGNELSTILQKSSHARKKPPPPPPPPSVLLSMGQCHRDTSLTGLNYSMWERWAFSQLCLVRSLNRMTCSDLVKQ